MEEQSPRIMVYAINESDRDFDVRVTITGSNFRQSRARPRFIRVPSASKVFVKTLIPLRGKKAEPSFDIELNDSLSGRSLILDFEKIKLRPPKPIIFYVPAVCEGCDSLIASANRGKYLYTRHNLDESPEIKTQLIQVFGGKPLDTLPMPIVSLGGKLYTNLQDYSEILEILENSQ